MKVYELARRKAARMLREHWDGELPVRLAPFTDAVHASKYESDLDGVYSGMVTKESGKDPIIVLNSDEPVARRRFTWAHEIGHILERSEVAKDDDYSFSEHRGRKYDLHEFFADEFAGALLIPADELRRADDERLTEGQVARRFGVSLSALTKRRTRLKKAPE